VTIPLQPGDVVSYRTCGGGGYGDAHARDPEAVAADVRAGKISLERAGEVYGVVIDPATGQVVAGATARRRAGTPAGGEA
jgi:N-methylhydantoinase B